MWIVYSVALHLLLLGSIFVIYFRSPVITNLQPQPSLLLTAPATRLVLFVTDGLRAESFFHNHCENVPRIKELIRKKDGLVGISHTRVPTESRPGHIALIAGLYEDPSAVTRGWKENPIEFDTVFNRSHKTYAWGANDVLHIFSRLTKDDEHRLFFDSYSHELDFSGKEKTYELDQWVFQRVENLLRRKAEQLKDEKRVIFFLHLLGLDTAGHVHKPGSELFIENLRFTDDGIRRMYELFESLFPDGKTAYLLTSDHGMTNAGSHGAGESYETETPFFIWGSGINTQPYEVKSTYFLESDQPRPLYDMEQAQMAPLMSALLGIGVPMNNFGTLPKDFLNASMEYRFAAAYNNALQLKEQYRALFQQHEQGLLAPLLPKYGTNLDAIKDSIQQQAKSKDFTAALQGSYELMESALQGIDYYFSYYRSPLLVATSATFFGFLGHLLKLLTYSEDYSRMSYRSYKGTKINLYFIVAVGFAIVGFCLLQKVPWSISLYFLLPVVVWYLFLSAKGNMHSTKNLKQLLLIVVCCELLVYTFFERRAISAGFLLFALYEKINKDFLRRKLKAILSLLLSLLLVIFPLLPPSVGYSNYLLLYAGIFLTLVRPFLVKNVIPLKDRMVVLIALINAVTCIYMHSQKLGLALLSQIISWSFLAYVIVSLFRSSDLSVKHRLERFIFLLSSLYCLLCTSYESLFILLLISELIASVDSKQRSLTDRSSVSAHDSESFRYAFVMLLYTFFSFFGTGNIASVSSFDPNIIRCFLTTFSPFVIMLLVILKLIIPLLLIISIIFALSPYAVRHERQIFICLLIICDVMGLNFLFLVKNQGSWLEIGSSISHFVIMQVTTVVLAIFVILSKILLRIHATKGEASGVYKIK